MPHSVDRQRTQAPLAAEQRTRALVARSTALSAELGMLIERSRAGVGRARETVRQSRELALVAAYPHLRAIVGGSDGPDAALIAAAITGAPLCVDCIARKSGVPQPGVEAVLAVIGASISLIRRTESCAGCLAIAQVFGLPNGGPKRGTRGHIVRFLEEHPGGAFCADCIASHLFGTKNIDVALRQIEGGGVHRRYAACSACGKPRLVASVSSSN